MELIFGTNNRKYKRRSTCAAPFVFYQEGIRIAEEH